MKKALSISRTGNLIKHNLRDLLDRSLIERGKLEPSIDLVDMNKLVKNVVSIMSDSAHSREIAIRIHSELENNDQFFVDGHRVQQIILNLLSNAIKFSRKCTCIDVEMKFRAVVEDRG